MSLGRSITFWRSKLTIVVLPSLLFFTSSFISERADCTFLRCNSWFNFLALKVASSLFSSAVFISIFNLSHVWQVSFLGGLKLRLKSRLNTFSYSDWLGILLLLLLFLSTFFYVCQQLCYYITLKPPTFTINHKFW